eukprot:m.150745 g.150745  ORF g.150745 m.150745 type:complete len:568 (+) comp14270_c0_seq4:127-1830(+)
MNGVVALAGLLAAAAGKKAAKPNFVFLHDESTDGRLYLPESTAVPIPNIRSLQARGVTFDNHYVNVPICCPSRGSMWSGRQPHNVPHMHNGIAIRGAWNNYEGVGIGSTRPGVNEDDLMGPHLASAGYTTQITGKTDWRSGGHSLTTMVDSWTIYARFPYSVPEQGGFHIWGDCGGNLSVLPGNTSAHEGDWKIVHQNTEWIGSTAHSSQPFFLYQGLNIVHPEYDTSEEYLKRIDQSAIKIPFWPPLETLHPCDFQTTLKKGCALPYPYQNTSEHKRSVIAGYYAMIAEYDDMVGEYITAIDKAGLTDSTIFVLSSDHGDMQMQHQQFYKMVAYEGSTHVPLVIAPGKNFPELKFRGRVRHLTSHIDMYPTFMALAGATPPAGLDGQSLVPFLTSGESPEHPTSILSQFHGENLVMSWYMVREGEMKATFWGTGKQHPPQIFNLTEDPDENHNLALDPDAGPLIAKMEALIMSKVDYPKVSMQVAEDNIAMAKWWTQNQSLWKCIVNGTCELPKKTANGVALNPEWGQLWQLGPAGYWMAWEEWINSPPKVVPCMAAMEYAWPPAQ